LAEVYWYSRTRHDRAAPLEEALEAGAVVVEGGMAGLAAALDRRVEIRFATVRRKARAA